MRTQGLALALLAILAIGPDRGFAQPAPASVPEAAVRPDVQQLRERAERRYKIVEVRRGMILIPKSDSARTRTIDINDGQVSIDGAPLTGRELRERLGDDADLIVQLSFLDGERRRAFFAEPVAPAPPALPAPVEAPGAASRDPRDEGWSEVGRYRHGGARVRFGGDVTVAEDEAIGDDVVAILGTAIVDGRVDGNVVAVGGSIRLGPKANIRGDVTAVGGSVDRTDTSVVSGQINEVRVAAPTFAPFADFRPWRDWHWFDGPFRNPFGGSVDLIGTLVRVGLVGLLAALLVAVVPSPVRRVADRVATEPWRAGFVGLAAQLLFVPLLIITVVVLAVSIIGIPLLLLVPFGLLAAAVALVMGFAGSACAVGRWAGRRAGTDAPGLIVSLVVGLAIVFALTIIARFLGMAGLPVRIVLASVLAVGFLIEYVAWTVGLGGVLLSRFGRREAPGAVPSIPA